MWTRIDVRICYLHHLGLDDECYYAREYTVRGGYAASETNNLILNLKIKPTAENRYRLKYKDEAIRQFARELLDLLPAGAVVVAMPPSCPPGHPAYDDRIARVLQAVTQAEPSIRVVEPFRLARQLPAAHAGGQRDPDEILAALEWRPIPPPVPDAIVLVDDVITSGGHFKACKALLTRNIPGITVIGAMWARGVNPAE